MFVLLWTINTHDWIVARVYKQMITKNSITSNLMEIWTNWEVENRMASNGVLRHRIYWFSLTTVFLCICCALTTNALLFRAKPSCSAGYKQILLGLATINRVAVNRLWIVRQDGRCLYLIRFEICLFSFYITLQDIMASPVYDSAAKTTGTHCKQWVASSQEQS